MQKNNYDVYMYLGKPVNEDDVQQIPNSKFEKLGYVQNFDPNVIQKNNKMLQNYDPNNLFVRPGKSPSEQYTKKKWWQWSLAPPGPYRRSRAKNRQKRQSRRRGKSLKKK